MVVWPSIAAYSLGRVLGRCFSIKWPNIYIFRLGNLFALLAIPLGIALYFYRLAPSLFGLPLHGGWYKLTNRRVIRLRNEINLEPLTRGGQPRRLFGIPLKFPKFRYGAEVNSVALDHFEAIEVHVRSGQEWYHAGDLIFKSGETEVFRLEGVSRPEAFRHCCLKAHLSYVGVQQALAREAAHA